MNILVCFKAVADMDTMTESDWLIDDRLQIDLKYIKTALNCFDESALEMALKLSDTSDSFNAVTTLTAITVGDERSDPYLKNILALKYDKAVRIDCNLDLRFNPQAIAQLIAKYLHYGQQQAIFMGRQSGVGDNAQTPFLIAELLGWQCISQVTEIELTSIPDTLKVKRQADGGYFFQTVKLPAVFSIGDSPNSYMRVPTLKDKMRASKKQIELLTLSALGETEKTLEALKDRELISLSRIKTQRRCVIINGKTAHEKAKILYDEYLKARLKG